MRAMNSPAAVPAVGIAAVPTTGLTMIHGSARVDTMYARPWIHVVAVDDPAIVLSLIANAVADAPW